MTNITEMRNLFFSFLRGEISKWDLERYNIREYKDNISSLISEEDLKKRTKKIVDSYSSHTNSQLIDFLSYIGGNIHVEWGNPSYVDLYTNQDSFRGVTFDAPVYTEIIIPEVIPPLEKREIVYNDQIGNRGRACREVVIYKGEAMSPREAEKRGLIVLESLGYTQQGKWSNTTWRVTLRSPRLVVFMSPFEGWSDSMEDNIDHVISSNCGYTKEEITREEAELAFRHACPSTYLRSFTKGARKEELP